MTDPLNNVTANAFDNLLRLTTRTLPGSATSTVAHTYHAGSNQVQTLANELARSCDAARTPPHRHRSAPCSEGYQPGS